MKCIFRTLTLSLLGFAILFSSYAFSEDINGKWKFDYGYYMTFSGSGGSFTGSGGEGSSYTWVITNGTISGNNVSWKESYNEITYLVDRVGTINGDTMTGSWTSSWGQSGGFTATRVVGSGGGGGSPTPTPSPTPAGVGAKRPTAISLFCNRIGVLLERASCAATVGDAGAPPRSTPTGYVTFAATNGFFPASAQCALQQTPYSPGVSSCIAEFQVPNGFPVGAKFPIDATYGGDTNFAPSSTSHTLIQAGCVGDANNPCSGAVALTFSNLPQILKGKVQTVFECGKLATNKSLNFSSRGINDALNKCLGTLKIDAQLGEILSGLTLEEYTKLAASLSKAEAESDLLLNAIRASNDPKYQLQLQQSIGKQQELTNLMVKILNDQAKLKKDAINNIKSLKLRFSNRASKKTTFLFGTAPISVNNGKVKTVTVKLTKPAKAFVRALTKSTTNRTISLTFGIKGQRSPSGKRKFNSKQNVQVGVN